MPQYIIHKDGVFNVFSTVVDAPLIERGLSHDELQDWYRQMNGEAAMAELPERVARAVSTGTSALTGTTLQELIAFNRAGQHESLMPPAEFERQFLTRESADQVVTSGAAASAENSAQDHSSGSSP